MESTDSELSSEHTSDPCIEEVDSDADADAGNGSCDEDYCEGDGDAM
jgi:hypothetical protein